MGFPNLVTDVLRTRPVVLLYSLPPRTGRQKVAAPASSRSTAVRRPLKNRHGRAAPVLPQLKEFNLS